MTYRTLSIPAAPAPRPSLPRAKRVLHQIVRRFDLDQSERWRRIVGGRWARFVLVQPDTMEAPDDLIDRVVRRYGRGDNGAWAKAMSPQWHPMLGCPCSLPSACMCEVWP